MALAVAAPQLQTPIPRMLPTASPSASQGPTDSQNGASETVAPPVSPTCTLASPITVSAESASAPRRQLCCPHNHPLREIVLGEGKTIGQAHRCDDCGLRGIRWGRLHRCEECDYDLCSSCTSFRMWVARWADRVDNDSICPPVPEETPPPKTGRVPAVWIPDSYQPFCQSCGTHFSVVVRKHHCRACGHCVCKKCSPDRLPVPDMGYDTPVRVCKECADLHHSGGMDIPSLTEADADQDADEGQTTERLTAESLQKCHSSQAC